MARSAVVGSHEAFSSRAENGLRRR
ncbi:MAG: hypothetical protein RL486_1162, partial [Actinomycetota bacterium]